MSLEMGLVCTLGRVFVCRNLLEKAERENIVSSVSPPFSLLLPVFRPREVGVNKAETEAAQTSQLGKGFCLPWQSDTYISV